MDCKLDRSTGESSAENALSSVNDIAATDESGKYQTTQQGNLNAADSVMEDRKPAPLIPESNNLEKDSCKEDCPGLLMTNRVQSGKLANCREANEDSLVEENLSRSHTVDESDDSDIVVQDVKVCDICGDAGREDLLAICCRCSDGAEHTYCMRETLEKVPEGDWMCEECQYDEEMKNRRQRKVVNVDGNGNTSSGKASGGNSNACLKSDTRSGNDIDITSKDSSNMKILGKRSKQDTEVSSIFKKQAVESVSGSPKTSGSTIVASLSREVSLRNLERGKEKLAHQSSSSTPVASDDTDTARALVTSPRRLTARGSLLKSNSFTSVNAKPKVKLADEAVPMRQKLVREPPQLDMKEGIGKSYGKSMSFRSIGSGGYGNGESKVKMLSPKFTHNQDIKGFKHTKERSVLERKSSFKSERPVVSSPRVSSSISNSKNEKKVGSGDETSSLSSESNNHRSRAVHSDSKTSSLSKTPSLSSRRTSNNHVLAGEGNRQSLEVSNKEAPLLSVSTGRPGYGDSNESLIDESSLSKDAVSNDETIKENDNQSKKNTRFGGMNEICQKCKKVGHLAQSCLVDGLPDVATSKSLREVTNGSNDLKAAIEAAMLRKPGICRKSRIADQFSDSSQASKNSDIVSQDHVLGSVSKKNVYSGLVKDVVTVVRNSPNSCRRAPLDNVATSSSTTGDGGLVVSYDANTSIRDLPFQPPSPISVLWKTSAIPEHELSWQGNFEVHKNDKIECCDGVQAHLSTCASPRVLNAVNNFSQRVVLSEAPRLSTWPLQFQEYGIKEDNVALYFFAKNVDSYEKSYKILLERMIKKDLALIGIIEGAELLIFPSTQLPQQSQRWNMLHFLWGVFRGKKSSQSYPVRHFPEKNHLQQNLPMTISLPENICSFETVEKDLASNASLVAEVTASKDGFDVSGAPSPVQAKETDKVKLETQGGILGSDALTSPKSSSVKEEIADLKCNLEAEEAEASDQTFLRYASISSEHMPGQRDTFHVPSEIVSSQVLAEGGMSNKWITGADHVNHGTIIGDVGNRIEAPLVKVSVTPEQIRKDLCSTQLNELNCKLHVDGKTISEAISTSSSQAIQIDKDEDVIVLGTHKRQKIGSDRSNGTNDQFSSSSDDFSMRLRGVASGSSVIVSGEAFAEKTPSSRWGNAERFFFPVDPAPEKHIFAADKPGKANPLENQVRIEPPNLDLALGGETGLSTTGIPSFLVDKKVIQDDRPEKQDNGEEEDIAGSLSLSLSFPFSDKEQDLTSISKTGQLTERPRVNQPFILFGGISDK